MNAVYILNMGYTGLAIAKAFTGKGILVRGISPNKSSFGNYSRYIHYHQSPSGQTDPAGLCDFLINLSKTESLKPLILSTNDHDVAFLDRYRYELADSFYIVQAEHEIIYLISNKWKLYNFCKKNNIPTPGTIKVESLDDLKKQESYLRYPVLVKPVYSKDWRNKKIWDVVGGKAVFVDTREQLFTIYKKIEPLNPTVLIQEYITGEDRDIYTFCSYCNPSSQVMTAFNTQKILQVPEKLGTGVIVQSTVNQAVSRISKKILKQMNYSGISEIEYKWDSERQQYFLIEINPRFWDQHTLSQSIGINLPLFLYNTVFKKNSPGKHLKNGPCTWVAEITVLEYLLSELLKKRKNPFPLIKNLKGTIKTATLNLKDPLPFIKLLMSRVLRNIKNI